MKSVPKVVFNPWALELHSSCNMQEPRLKLEDLIFFMQNLTKKANTRSK